MPKPNTNAVDGRERERQSRTEDHSKAGKRFFVMAFSALGVVFGDIGTSPIYAIRECFHGEFGIAPTPGNILGVLSLVFWTLLLIVSIKYMMFVFRANNRGEGGVIALTALLIGSRLAGQKVRMGIIALGVFAACLLYGDGMITPAISVLSAVEGIGVITPVFGKYILPLTILILVSLFMIQKHGTARIGVLFGPIIFCWVTFLAVTGIVQLCQNPGVLSAILPLHAVSFLIENNIQGFIVLGAVFLVVTGTEALYADMGHFGANPIRFTWLCFVFPALLLNYFGQGALLLKDPELISHPFYSMVPSYLLVPVVILATLATIIASQAVISGAFSLTRQAIQLGYFPRLKITHTSSAQIGQIYIGPVNWILMICTICLVLVFKSSSLLAGAYGVAVTSTMMVTSILFYNVARRHFKWPAGVAILLLVLFISIDLPFFIANFSKIFHGAWLPLAIGAMFFAVMWTWKIGREKLGQEMSKRTASIEQLEQLLIDHKPQVVHGTAVFLTGKPMQAPLALLQNIRHNRVIHDRTIILHYSATDAPYVTRREKVSIDQPAEGIFQVSVNSGFMEDTTIEETLALMKDSGLEIEPERVSYFLGRERLVIGAKPILPFGLTHLFLLVARNTTDVSSFFSIPPEQVVEVGVQLEV